MKALRYLPFLKRGFVHAGPPLHLTVYVTGRCNLRCRHCFYWEGVLEGAPGPSLEDFERLAESTQRMGPLLWISFGGGEPFLRDDLDQIAASFGKRGLRHLTIPTNGLVGGMEDRVRALLAAAPDTVLSISVSFDGPPDIHDAIRLAPGGHAKSCKTVRRLVSMAKDEPRLGVGLGLTVTKENQELLADHAEELVRELRPHNLTINLARGTAPDSELLEVDIERYEEVVARKRKLMEQGLLPYFDFPLASLAVARDRMMYEHVARVARSNGTDLADSHLPCTAGKLSAVIFENGQVHPCEVLGESLGNLNDHDWDLQRLWSAADAANMRDRIRETRCRCTWECAQADNVLFRPQSWPRLGMEVLKK
ncbi:MAG: MoaA/NifB/PqqE/SkfB family radical SAM enzyme [Planctomycetota bacterium]|jgi:MoaA/NifB/PqqE/SkfB family radical SAM enzyme